MKHWIHVLLATFIVGNAGVAGAQHNTGRGRVMTPASSIERPGDAGVRAHTHLRIFEPEDGRPFVGPPFTGYGYETPRRSVASTGSLRKSRDAIQTRLRRIQLAEIARSRLSMRTTIRLR